jgi:hypothetical protein
LGDAGFNTFAQDLTFEFGEDGQHAGHSPSGWRHVGGFGERNEADAQLSQLFQCHNKINKIGKRSPPAIQAPDEDCVDLASTNSGQQVFAPGPLQCGRNDLLYLDGNVPASTDGILAHGFDLQWKSLLIVGGDAGVERHLKPT